MFREDPKSLVPNTVRLFPHDHVGKQDRLIGGGCSVRQDYVEELPKQTTQTLEAARGIETRFLKDRKMADALKKHNQGGNVYVPGQGFPQPGKFPDALG